MVDIQENMVVETIVGKWMWEEADRLGTSFRDRPADRLNEYGGYVWGKKTRYCH